MSDNNHLHRSLSTRGSGGSANAAAWVVLAGLFFPSVLPADPFLGALSAVRDAGSVYTIQVEEQGPGILQFTNPGYGGGYVMASVISDSNNGVVVAAFGNGFTFSRAVVYYEIQIAGPENIDVPVEVSGLVAAGGIFTDGSSSASAYVEISLPGVLWSQIASDETGGSGSPSHYFRETLNIRANQALIVALGATTSIWDYNGLYGEVGSAYADPFFQIDPAFLTTNPGYSVELSAGAFNVPVTATPEPTTGAAVCAGVLLALPLLRSRAAKSRGNDASLSGTLTKSAVRLPEM
jgi:hypothetical protein